MGNRWQPHWDDGIIMRIALLGATGTIGQATAKALLRHGHDVICPVRARAGVRGSLSMEKIRTLLAGAELLVGEPSVIFGKSSNWFQHQRIDAIVSCLASRTGTPSDAWAVDYRLHANILSLAESAGVKHFVLLSAICVQKPLLEFQQAKLAFETALIASDISYSIIRPTAFFKSLAGQVQRLKQGKPYLVFGDGRLTACKPISDRDLAEFLVRCLTDNDKLNRILPIGGPGAAITPLEQGDYLFKRLGKKPHFRHVPIQMIDAIIFALRTGGHWLPSLADKAELAKIGRYYATESMLAWDPLQMKYDAQATPSWGTDKLFAYYDRLIDGDEEVELGDHAVF